MGRWISWFLNKNKKKIPAKFLVDQLVFRWIFKFSSFYFIFWNCDKWSARPCLVDQRKTKKKSFCRYSAMLSIHVKPHKAMSYRNFNRKLDGDVWLFSTFWRVSDAPIIWCDVDTNELITDDNGTTFLAVIQSVI